MTEKREIFVGFGSNLGNREKTIHEALTLLSKALGSPERVSSLYHSKAQILQGAQMQPLFINGAALFITNLEAERILEILLATEQKLGRQRNTEKRWEARSIDLDLLFVGPEIHDSNLVTIPHPELHKRDFVLAPICEISPSFIHPVLNQKVSKLYETLLASDSECYVQTTAPFLFQL